MNKQQYDAIVATLNDNTLDDDAKIAKVIATIGIDISDEALALDFKTKIVGNGAMKIKENADETVSVSFDGIEVTSATFAMAFIATLMNVVADRALDKFLPQAAPEKATGSRSGGLGSPAGNRQLPRPRGGF